MKKIFYTLFAAILMACSLSACNVASANGQNKDDTLQIVTTIFPEYDWVRCILGENPGNAEITLLLDNGADLHSYQPSAADIMKISNCDLFIYVGGESDEWVEGALKNAVNKNMVVINLMEALGDEVMEEEIVEGMEHEHEHGEDEERHHDDGDEEHDHEEHHHEDGDEEHEMDEHVWLSLRKAGKICAAITDALVRLDAENADAYRNNCKAYQAKLAELDERYVEAVNGARLDTLLFGDRFPFRYLLDDYGLKYYAAFVGCSTETNASFDTIKFLANKVEELKLPAILTLEGDNHRIAETVRDNTQAKDQKILSLDSLQSVTKKNIEEGVTYYSVMNKNLETLQEALGQ